MTSWRRQWVDDRGLSWWTTVANEWPAAGTSSWSRGNCTSSFKLVEWSDCCFQVEFLTLLLTSFSTWFTTKSCAWLYIWSFSCCTLQQLEWVRFSFPVMRQWHAILLVVFFYQHIFSQTDPNIDMEVIIWHYFAEAYGVRTITFSLQWMLRVLISFFPMQIVLGQSFCLLWRWLDNSLSKCLSTTFILTS